MSSLATSPPHSGAHPELNSPVSNNAKPRVLVVVEHSRFNQDQQARLEQTLAFADVYWLYFAFAEQVGNNGFLSQMDAHNPHLCRVDEQTRSAQGRFASQALNRMVANRLIGERISHLIVLDLYGCTVDLPRIAHLLGCDRLLWLDTLHEYARLPSETRQWLDHSLAQSQLWCADKALAEQLPREPQAIVPASSLFEHLARYLQAPFKPAVMSGFDYAVYEFCLRDHPLLVAQQRPDTVHFNHCQNVLDLGCGAGIFLDLLAQSGVNAHGVERCEPIAEYGRGMGLDIITDDALDYLARQHATVDGIYCSHFVEHLPFEAVARLIHDVAAALQPGGVAVFAFPDPESIRSQLLGFWRDPEHVRYYHPQLIETIAMTEGLMLDWSSYDDQPHHVPSFSARPPELPEMVPLKPVQQPFSQPPKRWFERIVNRLGLLTKRQLWAERAAQQQQFADFVEQQQRWNQAMAERSEKLWAVNQTWAWNDNVTLRFVKRG